MANLLNTAISGLKLSQLALSITGQNIVNANTEGYSRQSLTSATTAAQRTPVGYVGTGVQVTDIVRHTQQYLVDQVGRDISSLSNFDTYLSNISQTDNLLANPNSSLGTSMGNFFAAMNEAANDPASLLGRQLLVTQTQLMTQGFKTMEAKLLSQNESINKQLGTLAANITTIARDLAKLNEAIGKTVSVSGSQLPNDLLDQRDQLIRDLSALVDVTVTRQGDQTIDVFVAEGQSLVVGNTARQIVSVAGSAESERHEIAFVAGNTMRVITKQITGGELGGLTRYRSEALDPALNSLGRIALAVADGLNQQQKLGIDLEGSLGHAMFTDINDRSLIADRVRPDSNNRLPDDRAVSVRIDDVNALTVSDYSLKFEGLGSQYSITRESDGKLMAEGILGNKLPLSVSMDGFTVTLESGSFQSGDKFTILPTKTGASEIKALITRPEEFAFASPIRTQTGAGNSGGAFVVPGKVLDISTPTFTSAPGELSPPIMIRFTSSTSYDVLDYSDPANPIPLRPPLSNQTFSPGAINNIFPSDPGGTTVSTYGSAAGRISVGQIHNGYSQEALTFVTSDPVTGYTSEQRFLIQQNESAFDIAQRLSNLKGMSANAKSALQLSNFVSDNLGSPLTIMLNGVNLSDPNFIVDGELTPQPLPDPLTADFLRDRINVNNSLKERGISATSDGETLTVRSTKGVDLTVKVGGNAGDSVSVRDGDLRIVTGRASLKFSTTIAPGSGFDIDFGFGKKHIALSPGTYAASEVAQAVQADIDAAIGAGVVEVRLNAQGKLEIQSVGNARPIKTSNVSNDDPLGLSLVKINGPDEGPVAAVLANGKSANDPYDFSGANATTFLLVVNDNYASNITLNQNYSVDSGAAIVADIQAQIDAASGASGVSGRVTVALDDKGVLQFTTAATGEMAKVSIAANPGTQGLLNTATAIGRDTGGSNASLLGNVSLASGFNFDANGPHSFNIAVDGHDPIMVSLTGDSALPAVFTGDQNVAAGLDFSAGAHSFDVAVNGGGVATINLGGVDTTLAATPNDVTPLGLITHVQARLDAQLGVGVVTAGLDANNQITLTSVQKGDGASLALSNPVGSATAIMPVAGGSVTGSEQRAQGVASIVRDAINTALAAQGLGSINVGVSTNGFLTLDSSTYGVASQLRISDVQGTYGALFQSNATGVGFTNDVTVGGTLDVQLAADMTLNSNRRDGLFGEEPKGVSNFMGYQVGINSGQGVNGAPKAGDSFVITYNTDGTADNRNGAAMLSLNTALTVSNGNLTYQGAYGQLVESLGILTSQARLSQAASETLLRQSMDTLQGVSGVNIEEEAAMLIKFEQHYNASARLITMAKEMFDTIVSI